MALPIGKGDQHVEDHQLRVRLRRPRPERRRAARQPRGPHPARPSGHGRQVRAPRAARHGGGGIASLAGSILAANRMEAAMPLVNVKLIEGVFTDDQKHEIVEKLTDAMVEIEGENMRGVTWVVIDEVKSGDWGIGGQALTTEHVRELAAGAPA